MSIREFGSAALIVSILLLAHEAPANTRETFQGVLNESSLVVHSFSTVSAGDIAIALDWDPGIYYAEDESEIGSLSTAEWSGGTAHHVTGDGILRVELSWDPLTVIGSSAVYSHLNLYIVDNENGEVLAADEEINPFSGFKSLTQVFSGISYPTGRWVSYRVRSYATLAEFTMRSWTPRTADLWMDLYDDAGNLVATSRPPNKWIYHEGEAPKPQSLLAPDMPAGTYEVKVRASFASATYRLDVEHS